MEMFFQLVHRLLLLSGVNTGRFQHRYTDFGHTNMGLHNTNLCVPKIDHSLSKNYKEMQYTF